MNLFKTKMQAASFNGFEAILDNVTLGCYKPVEGWMIGSSAGSLVSINLQGIWRSTAAITSITIYTAPASNFTNGNITLLGVN